MMQYLTILALVGRTRMKTPRPCTKRRNCLHELLDRTLVITDTVFDFTQHCFLGSACSLGVEVVTTPPRLSRGPLGIVLRCSLEASRNLSGPLRASGRQRARWRMRNTGGSLTWEEQEEHRRRNTGGGTHEEEKDPWAPRGSIGPFLVITVLPRLQALHHLCL
eukprot:7549037-Pyramimonas_sp.AAC.1